MNPQLVIPTQRTVIELCRGRGKHNDSFAFDEDIWIKYGPATNRAEADIQQYVYKHADSRLVLIPEVFDTFETQMKDDGPIVGFIVMQRMKGKTCESYFERNSLNTDEERKKLLLAIVKALRHIWTIPLPQQARPGPLGGRYPAGGFFGAAECDQTFNNLQELEGWINLMLERIHENEKRRSREKAPPQKSISLVNQGMQICHCDLNPSNILVGEQITIIDWGWSGTYPECFEEFGVFKL